MNAAHTQRRWEMARGRASRHCVEASTEYDLSRYFFLRLAWPPPGAVGKRVDDLDNQAGLQCSADVVGGPCVVARGESGGDRGGCNNDAPDHNGSR